jgi:hypothetical protein
MSSEWKPWCGKTENKDGKAKSILQIKRTKL